MTVLDLEIKCYSDDENRLAGCAVVTDIDNGYRVTVVVGDGTVVGLLWSTVMPPGEEVYDYFLTYENEIKQAAQSIWSGGPQ
jgi:hypothetical protein